MLFKFYSSSTRNTTPRNRGFGLVELMVSISIMTLVSTIILVKNRSFNNALLLRNQAYEVAFALREAQLLAVSGNKEDSTHSNQYGIYFDLATAQNTKYRIFRDDDNDSTATKGWYTTDDTTIGTIGNLDPRFAITDILNSSGTALNIDALSVTFIRPNFDALLRRAGSPTPVGIPGPIYLKITPKDTSGYDTVPFRLVEITSTGQISVK